MTIEGCRMDDKTIADLVLKAQDATTGLRHTLITARD